MEFKDKTKSGSMAKRRSETAVGIAIAVVIAAVIITAACFAIAHIFKSDNNAGGGDGTDGGGGFLGGLFGGRDEETTTPSVGNDGEIVELPDWITVDLLPKNEFSRPGEPTDEIVGIVIHYVGNPSTTAKANRNYFASLAKSGETYASSNFIVGLDGEVILCVPLGEVAYCSNFRNHDTVSIECCHPDAEGKFNDETYASLIRLCRFLVDVYGITPENVIRHYDVTGKMCPNYYVENEDAWRALVDDIFAEPYADTESSTAA